MGNVAIGKILKAHSIPYYEKNGRIFADSMLAGTEVFEEMKDLTGISRKKLYEWLGY